MKKLAHKVSGICIYLNTSDEKLLTNENCHTFINMFFDKINKVYSGVPIYITSSSLALFLKLKLHVIATQNEFDFLKEASLMWPTSIYNDPDIDETYCAYFDGIFPFLDLEITAELEERHITYLSQYSYSENLPPGIIPKFLSREFIQSLPDNFKGTSHEFLLKNINNFDVEILFKHPDIRQFRLDFTLSNPRSIRLIEEIIGINPTPVYSEIPTTITQNSVLMRPYPTYIEIELTNECKSKCTFCPRQYFQIPETTITMKIETIEKIFDGLIQLKSHHPTICFGGWGEPTLHPDFVKILAYTTSQSILKEVIVETSLTDMKFFNEDFKFDDINSEKISFIINLTTADPEKYEQIYGKNHFSQVIENIEKLRTYFPKSEILVQFLKIQEIEQELESAINFFKQKNIDFIIQKYNSYSNFMPEKRISDMTPVKREFCWHLARDIYILSDGAVTICKQSREKIGNLTSENLQEIWSKNQNRFQDSINNNHSKICKECTNCDEWYTFNA